MACNRRNSPTDCAFAILGSKPSATASEKSYAHLLIHIRLLIGYRTLYHKILNRLLIGMSVAISFRIIFSSCFSFKRIPQVSGRSNSFLFLLLFQEFLLIAGL